MCFGGGSGTNENDIQLENVKNARLREERAAEEAARLARKEQEAKDLREWQARLENAYNFAVDDASQYFVDQGVNVSDYMNDISKAAQRARLTVPEMSTDVMSYFNNLGQQVYDQALSAERNRYSRDLNTFGNEGFDRRLITNAADDASVNAVLEAERREALQNLQRLRDRNILSDTGFAAAVADLEDQRFGAKSALEELSEALLEGGRADLRNIVSEGRSRINNLDLGAQFDPFQYERDINNEVTNFFSGFGDALRGNLVTDLFDVSSAFGRGSTTQGAGNTGYDLNASLGLFDAVKNKDDEDEQEDNEIENFFAAF